VDKSGSIGHFNFSLMKSFLSHLVAELDIDSGITRVGLVPYSTHVATIEAFNLSEYSSVTSVQSAIASLSYSRGFTYTNKVLAYVRTKMLTPAAGDRSDVPNVVILITDGRSTKPSATEVCTMWQLMKKRFLKYLKLCCRWYGCVLYTAGRVPKNEAPKLSP